ncbi:hypothetical protein L0Z72_03845, partial [candidate division KSB1 bacterium]|nr:hypothetical protein [candidate division KSB1 bacterium]
DVFDALTSKRHYRDRMEFENVMDIMMNNAGSHFDRNIIDAFKKIRIDRLIEILEIDYIDQLRQEDLRYLAHFEVRHLLEVIKDGALNNEEDKMESLFYKYYQRKYFKSEDNEIQDDKIIGPSLKYANC